MRIDLVSSNNPNTTQYIEISTMQANPEESYRWIGKNCAVCRKVIANRHKHSGLLEIGNVEEQTSCTGYICSNKCFKIFMDNFTKENFLLGEIEE